MSNFENFKFSFKNIPVLTCLVQFCLRIPKMSSVLSYDNKKFLKSSLKNDVITITWFFGHCTAKDKDIALKFAYLLVAYSFIKYAYSIF